MCDKAGSYAAKRNWRAIAIVSLLSVFLAGATRAEENAPLPDHRVVLRISDDVLRSMMGNQNVDRVTEVHDNILGTSIHGQAHVVGKPAVKLAKHADKATFYITLQGEAHSTTTGYNGPAIVYSRGVTKFSAIKQVVFEPGRGFYGLPAKVTARTQTVITGVDSTRGGIIGNIVRRRASGIAAAQLPQATEIARQRAETRIAAAFDKSSEQRLARLNSTADFRALANMATRANGDTELKCDCCTTLHYMQIATRFGDGNSPIDLPVHTSANPRGAPIELWVHESLIGERVAAGIEMLATQVGSSDLLKAVSAATQLIGGNAGAQGTSPVLPGNQKFQVHKVSDWRKVEMEMPNQELATIARSIASVATPQPAPNQLAQRTLKPAIQQTTSPTKARIWTSGTHTAHAEFLTLDGELVRLRRVSGVRTNIRLSQLSANDQAWIQNHLAGR